MSMNNKIGHKWFGIRQEEGEGKGLIVVSLHGESQGGGCSRQYRRPVVRLHEGKDKQEWRKELIPFVQRLAQVAGSTRSFMAEAIKYYVHNQTNLRGVKCEL